MGKYYTRDTFKPVVVTEDYSKKLPNFQLVRPLGLEQQIERFVSAGRRVEQLEGLGVYDFGVNQPIDELAEDPTRDPDFDLIDAAVAQRDLILKLRSENQLSNETEEKNHDQRQQAKDPAPAGASATEGPGDSSPGTPQKA